MNLEPQLIRKPLRFERNFVQLPNTWVRDERLSFRARGLLGMLMSHDIGFKVTLKDIASTSPKEGIDAVRAATNELELVGYLKRVGLQGKGGKFEGTSWEITDPFDTGNLALFTALDYPTTVTETPVDNSATALDYPTRTALDNPTPIRTQVKNTKRLRLNDSATVAHEANMDASGGSLRGADASAEWLGCGTGLRAHEPTPDGHYCAFCGRPSPTYAASA
ncbi:hypothetical protein [Glaciibacter psychrotolerans]|uniref:Helix-turn-helix domain-containing protein n=1 Tax=Glaciibacter psychrotolerans TaxID=670054 RepID=A0A7Z0EH50_9MICO|nr:hypothetical protein [Leifsonia psychrotolerans]NYJ20819.1 hypothetical protein [Leifsonia psychrotolerans]